MKNFLTPSPRQLPWCLSKKIETQYPRVVETLGFSVSVTCDRRVRLLVVVVVVCDREWGGSFTSFHESGSERKRKKVTHYLLVVFRLRFLLIRLLLQLFSPSFLFIYFASFIPLFFFFLPTKNPYARLWWTDRFEPPIVGVRKNRGVGS